MNNDKQKINMRVEFDPAPIRHIAVECPKCKRWFCGWDITNDRMFNDCDINSAEFTCPVCDEQFGGWINGYECEIKRAGHPDIYEGCLKKREIWE